MSARTATQEVRASRRSRILRRGLESLARHAWFVEDEVAGLRDVVNPGDVCIDVGAEYGLYTHVLAALVGPSGTVIACEAQADAAATILIGTAAFRTPHVRLYTLAVADRPGHAELDVPMRRGHPVHGRAHLVMASDDEVSLDAAAPRAEDPNAGDPNAGDPNAEDPNAEFSVHRALWVPVTTIDELVDLEGLSRVDFLKADVEGAEALVVDGALQTLKDHRPLVQLEIEDRFTRRFGETSDTVVERLTALDYQLYGWADGRWSRTSSVTPERRNYLFVPAD